MTRALGVLALGLVAACTTSPGLAPSAEPSSGVSDGRYTMGTVLEITLHDLDSDSARETLDALFGEVARLDTLLSSYVASSDVTRLNDAAGGEPVPLAPPVVDVLERSVEFSRITGGAFDVTVGPLVKLWTEAAQRDALPTAEERRDAQARVGSSKIRIESGAARLTVPGMSVDLGGVAKGYALDALLATLEARGVRNALLNFGQSSTWALGSPPAADGWRLLVRAPDGGFVGIITLRDQALSVSGSHGQFSEIEGRRYGHILDPRTGEALLRMRQAVVVAPRADLAEALSKALLVLDAEEGLARVAAQRGCEGLLIEGDGALRMTPGFAEGLSFEPVESRDP